MDTATICGHSAAYARRAVIVGAALWLAAMLLMRLSVPSGVARSRLVIDGPGGKPCAGTLYQQANPRAVMLVGHGVSSNQGVMATIAKAFAANGYAVVALDFWGHGRSRERFEWTANPAQIHAWCAWARKEYGGLPLGYLGHSMGGFAGAEAFAEYSHGVSAFVSLGALPRLQPGPKTLIAAGRFEELFSPEEARRRAGDGMDVLISPFSNHALETWDPVLVRDIVQWVDGALGLNRATRFPWLRFLASLLAVPLGCAAAFVLAGQAAASLRVARVPAEPRAAARKWSLNPYRVAGRILGARGPAVPPRAGGFFRAALQAALFGGVFVLLLFPVLDAHIFTCGPAHPARLLMWAGLTPFLALPLLLDAWVLERLPLGGAVRRFAVAALTRAVPLLVFCGTIWFFAPRMAFGAMILAIFAYVLVMLSLVHAVAVRSTGDYRAGAFAQALLFAWVFAFWFPLARG